MKEKEFLQKIKDDAEAITPPASLQPEAIEQKLRKMQRNTASDAETNADQPSIARSEESNNPHSSNTSENKNKVHRYRSFVRFGSLAAVFALAVTAAYQSELFTFRKESPDFRLSDSRTTELSDSAADTGSLYETEFEAYLNEREVKSSIASYQEPEEIRANTPASLEEVYTALYDEFYYTEEEFFPGLGARLFGANDIVYDAKMEIAMEDSAVAESGSAMSSGSTDTGTSSYLAADTAGTLADYSETNIQEQGVDEGDIVKTDGTYIYILREDMSLAILEAASGNPKVVSITDLPQKNSGAIHEMYLDGDSLHIILTETVTELENEEDTYYTHTSRQTVLLTYDISDKANPTLTGQITQEGSYSDSRKNGQYIYLFTRYTPDIYETYEESTVAPLINGTAADPSDFYLPETLTDNAYLVISSVDTTAPNQIYDSKILVSGTSCFYVSQNNIYIANENYSTGYLTTELTKFHYENGIISGVAAASVKGYLNNSFSLNEYDGCLRVVSTYSNEDWEEENALFILDENLNQVSSIENLAEGETIRSARFFEDTGYFVTFRQTDPLFSVDLSDPANPQILGELKVSGFSSYLHFYGEDQLLGIGYEANEETGATTGIKLSMFDISNPANVTEINRYVIPNITWCPAIEDYKAILVQPEKNLIGFYCDNRYLVFSYDKEGGFTQELVYDFFSDNLTGQVDYYNMRGLYIEDVLYLAGNHFVVTFDMENNFTKQNILTID